MHLFLMASYVNAWIATKLVDQCSELLVLRFDEMIVIIVGDM